MWGKIALIASIVLSVSLLGVFKYSGFVFSNINALLGIEVVVPSFSLPAGISFYTFQIMSYTIHVYRGKTTAQRSFFNVLLYISLYFKLVADPIVRYTDISTQITQRNITIEQFLYVFRRFVIGLSKKVIFANAAGVFVDKYMNGSFSYLMTGDAWFGAVMFTLQIRKF